MNLRTSTSPTRTLQVICAREIIEKAFPPTRWYVEGFLHAGAILIPGDPKLGKSLLSLQLAIAVAGHRETVFGSLPVRVHGRVLYISSDDASQTRTQNRLRDLGCTLEEADNIDFCYALNETMGADLEAILSNSIQDRDYVMVVLDTLGSAMDLEKSNDVYRRDYNEGKIIQRIAVKHNILFLTIHHTNKAKSNKSYQNTGIQRSSGSNGLTGAMDAIVFLQKNKATVQSRDLPETLIKFTRGPAGEWIVSDGVDFESFKEKVNLTRAEDDTMKLFQSTQALSV